MDGAPTWTNLVAQGAAGSPGGRSGHSAVYDADRDVMSILGGIGQPADTWMLTAASGSGTPAWTLLNSGDGGPDPRTDSTAALDTSSSNTIIFGGVNTNYLNDVWVLAAVE